MTQKDGVRFLLGFSIFQFHLSDKVKWDNFFGAVIFDEFLEACCKQILLLPAVFFEKLDFKETS